MTVYDHTMALLWHLLGCRVFEERFQELKSLAVAVGELLRRRVTA